MARAPLLLLLQQLSELEDGRSCLGVSDQEALPLFTQSEYIVLLLVHAAHDCINSLRKALLLCTSMDHEASLKILQYLWGGYKIITRQQDTPPVDAFLKSTIPMQLNPGQAVKEVLFKFHHVMKPAE